MLKVIWYIAFATSWCLLEVAYMLVVLFITWTGLKVYCYYSSPSPAAATDDRYVELVGLGSTVTAATAAASHVAPRTTSSTDVFPASDANVDSSTIRSTSKPLNARISDSLRGDNFISIVPKVSKRKTVKICPFTQQQKTVLPSDKDNPIYNQISTDIPGESTNSETVEATATAASSTVTNISGNSCLLTTTKVEFSSVQPEVCRSTAVDRPTCTVTGTAATDKPYTRKLCSSAASESFPLSSSSSSYVAARDKEDPATSATTPRGQSLSTTPATGVINPAIMSSARNTASASICPPFSTAAGIPVTFAAVAAVRPIANLTSCAKVLTDQSVSVEPRPTNSASEAAHITVPSVQHVSRSVQPSSTLSSPNVAPKDAAMPAMKSQDTSETSDHKATTAIENTSAKPASGTSHADRAKIPNSAVHYPPESRAESDGKVTVVCSSSSSSPLLSSRGTSNIQPNPSGSPIDRSSDASTSGTRRTDEQAQFPLSEEYEFQLVCDVCFKPKTEQMMPVRAHSCRQDMLAVKEVGTGQWQWIRTRKWYVNFKGRYAMCDKHQCGRPNSCYTGCTYAHSDAERRLWDLEKMSTFSISEFISAHQTSAPICSVKSLLDKYPVSRSSVFLVFTNTIYVDFST